MFHFFKQHPWVRYFTIAGLVIVCCFFFWSFMLYTPYYMGWVHPLH